MQAPAFRSDSAARRAGHCTAPAGRGRSTALSSKCGQRHVDSRRSRLNTDLFTRAYQSDGWLGSRVVSVLNSASEGPGFKSLSGNSHRQTVHTHCASVHQAAKLAAALLRGCGGNCRPGGK